MEAIPTTIDDEVISQFVKEKLYLLNLEKQVEIKRQEQYPRLMDLVIGEVNYNDVKCNVAFTLKNRSLENIFNNGQSMKCKFYYTKGKINKLCYLNASVFKSNENTIILTFLANEIKALGPLHTYTCKIAVSLSTVSHDRMIT